MQRPGVFTPMFRRTATAAGFVLAILYAVSPSGTAAANGPLLFHLSGENGFTADIAGGNPEPTFLNNVSVIPDGARGKAFQCDQQQLFAFDAPGNIYAERGTLAFFWRSREPVGDAPFPIFRVGYADHSSWDYVWSRIDWNGAGFDAFVTDINLARPRISWKTDRPEPGDWHHFALSWDETVGIRFYFDGRKVGAVDTTAVFYAGLDQFGPHHRIVSPYQVQSRYCFERGGDIDELCIFDAMLDDAQVAALATGENPQNIEADPSRNLVTPRWRDEWLLRYGWNRPGDLPPVLDAPVTTVRKVEIHDVYDIKQWMWKGTDGIRETTWPYVYNRSRIPGRTDYFILPDWNCYSTSGKTVTFTMPAEPWNHIEIAGAAFGKASLLRFDLDTSADDAVPLFTRPSDQERTFHRLPAPVNGGKVQFTNELRETPIGEFQAYNVTPGAAPAGFQSLTYYIDADAAPDYDELTHLTGWIAGRFLPDERRIAVALPGGASRRTVESQAPALPLVHVLVPYGFRRGLKDGRDDRFSYTWENMQGGLDGIELSIPALDVAPLADGLFPLNIRVMDPLWPDRTLLDFSCSVKPGEARVLWLDTRDRILPPRESLYLTIAGSGADFSAAKLDGARVRLVFTDRETARAEHEIDRFTQVKDNLGQMVEEHPNMEKFRLYDRYERDITDLLRVNPAHEQGRYYWSVQNSEQEWPPFVQPSPPDGVPVWAFRQVECLKKVREFITWWIDERQIANGEFGGGLSDDGDMTNQFVGPALMGMYPDKIAASLQSLMDVYYDQGLFSNGLSTITTDELHVYEEGISVQPQVMLVDEGDPRTIERVLDTARAFERITGINDKGFRQVKSIFLGGNTVYSEGIWAVSRVGYSHLVFHPGLLLVDYNGHPATRKLILELCDGILAASTTDASGRLHIPAEIAFPSGEGQAGEGVGAAVSLFWAAWKWTGDRKYLAPIEGMGAGALTNLNANLLDELGRRDSWGAQIANRTDPAEGNASNRHIAWQMTGDLRFVEGYLGAQLQQLTQGMYMNTEGHWWIDRVYAESRELQRARLGGIALWRNMLHPGNYLGWRFDAPATAESVAILIPDATPERMTVIVYNLETVPVAAQAIGGNIAPGRWEIVQGIDRNGDNKADADVTTRTAAFERSAGVTVTFPPRATTVLTLRRTGKGTDYWKRPDLGIGAYDIVRSGATLRVTVHSLGSVPTPASRAAVVATNGSVLAEAAVPALDAPLDFVPKTAEIVFTLPAGSDLDGARVVLDPGGKLEEITERNNAAGVR